MTVYLVNVAASAIQLRFDGCLQNQLMHMYLAQAGGVKRKNFADGNLRFEPHYFDAESDLLSKYAFYSLIFCLYLYLIFQRKILIFNKNIQYLISSSIRENTIFNEQFGV